MLYCHDEAKFTYFIRMIEQGNFWLPLWSWEDGTVFHHTIKIRNCVCRCQRRRNYTQTSHNLTYSSNKRVSKAFIYISSAFHLPKMHRATRDKHVIKETPLIGQTYWESYSILQQISPNSHWWFLADFSPISHDLTNHSMLWFLRSYEKLAMLQISYDFSPRNHTILSDLGFHPLRDFSPISQREIISVN